MTTSKTNVQGTTNYQWDARGRLTQATLPGGQSINYSYDAIGRLAGRSANGVTTSSLYNGLDVVLDRSSDGGQVDYLSGAGIDNLLRQASPATGDLYFLQDQLGSTIALTNAAGGVVEGQQYEPFGQSQSSALTRFGYTGRERDAATGLLHYRARWYDPQLGRFISEDPAGFVGGLNLYAYVSNNPLSRTDPLGLYEIDVHYYLTYYLVRKNKCFSEEEAREIAEGDQGTDDNPKTAPGWGGNGNDEQRRRNRDYHGLHPGSHQPYLDKLWIDATRGHLNDPAANRNAFGMYLHYHQDTFSHAGYTDDIWGHGIDMHYPDKTDSDEDKSFRMAVETWYDIQKYAKEMKCGCQGEWTDASWKEVREFIHASGGSQWSDIADLPDLLERKRQILGVPPRRR